MAEKITSGKHHVNAEVSIKANSPLNIIITHGANNDMNYGLLVKLFDLLKKDYSVIRLNFSYVDQGLEKDEETNKAEIAACINYLGNKNIVLIGKSYGGVLSAMIASEGKFDIVETIILGYPLHEYGNPNNLQDTGYLKNAKVPIKFIIGDKDPNCDLDVFNRELPNYKPYIIKNSDHSYRPVGGVRSLKDNEDLVSSIVEGELKSITTSY